MILWEHSQDISDRVIIEGVENVTSFLYNVVNEA